MSPASASEQVNEGASAGIQLTTRRFGLTKSLERDCGVPEKSQPGRLPCRPESF